MALVCDEIHLTHVYSAAAARKNHRLLTCFSRSSPAQNNLPSVSLIVVNVITSKVVAACRHRNKSIIIFGPIAQSRRLAEIEMK